MLMMNSRGKKTKKQQQILSLSAWGSTVHLPRTSSQLRVHSNTLVFVCRGTNMKKTNKQTNKTGNFQLLHHWQSWRRALRITRHILHTEHGRHPTKQKNRCHNIKPRTNCLIRWIHFNNPLLLQISRQLDCQAFLPPKLWISCLIWGHRLHSSVIWFIDCIANTEISEAWEEQ